MGPHQGNTKSGAISRERAGDPAMKAVGWLVHDRRENPAIEGRGGSAPLHRFDHSQILGENPAPCRTVGGTHGGIGVAQGCVAKIVDVYVFQGAVGGERLELGCGRGAFAYEFGRFGVPVETSRVSSICHRRSWAQT